MQGFFWAASDTVGIKAVVFTEITLDNFAQPKLWFNIAERTVHNTHKTSAAAFTVVQHLAGGMFFF
jgi:hypothetical protein